MAQRKKTLAVFSINFSSINRFFLFEFNYIWYSSGLKNWKFFQFASIDQLIETHNSELSRVGMFNEHKKSDRSPHKGVWEWRRRRKKRVKWKECWLCWVLYVFSRVSRPRVIRIFSESDFDLMLLLQHTIIHLCLIWISDCLFAAARPEAAGALQLNREKVRRIHSKMRQNIKRPEIDLGPSISFEIRSLAVAPN